MNIRIDSIQGVEILSD